MVLEFLNQCEVCSKYKKTPARPKVGLAKSRDVNEIVSMDLKILRKSETKEIPLTPMGVLAHRLRTLDRSLVPPSS